MFFKCKHPASGLCVNKDESRDCSVDGWEIVTYHLFCFACKEEVDVKYARITDHEKAYEYAVSCYTLGA